MMPIQQFAWLCRLVSQLTCMRPIILYNIYPKTLIYVYYLYTCAQKNGSKKWWNRWPGVRSKARKAQRRVAGDGRTAVPSEGGGGIASTTPLVAAGLLPEGPQLLSEG
eukprot:6068920-Pyramimonas_sp.AAC.1